MEPLTKKEQFTRPPKELIERLRAFTTPELCDGAGLYHSMDYRIKPWIGRTKIVGPAVTVDVPSGEGDIVADAILELQEGDVLVVAGKGNCDCSYWGDHRSVCASLIRAEGVVIDGPFGIWKAVRRKVFPSTQKALPAAPQPKVAREPSMFRSAAAVSV